MKSTSRLACIMLATLGFLATNGFAATTVFTDSDEFFAAVAPGGYLEDFSGFPFGDPGNPILLGPVDGFSYGIGAPLGLFSGGGNMSTNTSFDPLIIQMTGDEVTAIGGNFWLTDIDFLTELGTLEVLVVDSVGTTTELLLDATPETFLGFVSDSPIMQLRLTPLDTPSSVAWATVDNLFVGSAAVIPLPGAIYLLGGALLLLARTRRR